MTAVFERILEMSLTAAVVIVVVLLIRLLLRKAPRKYSYALWSVAAFRLVCPVSFRAVFSLFNFTKRLEEVSVEQTVPLPSAAPVQSPAPSVTSAPFPHPSVSINPDLVVTVPAEPVVTPPVVEPEPVFNLLEHAMEIAAVVWLVGLAALVIYGIVSYVRLRGRMSTAVLLEGNVWQSDRVQSPFILGVVRPKIYLPFGLSADQQRYVLAHERYHIKRFDHIVRPLSFLILAVHWFNPLVWVAYYMMGRDMEMSCDEKVLSTEDNIRKAYSTTLLSFAANRRFPSPSPLAFGESGVKGRIKNALNWKKPRTWVTVIAILVCIVVIVVCAANPKEVSSETERLRDWCAAETAETVDMAYIVRDGQWSERLLSEEERETIAVLLNALPPEDLNELKNGGEWFAASSGVRVDTSWGTLHWYEGQLFTSWIRIEGGTCTGVFYWEVKNQTLADYVGRTIGGISHTLQNSRTPDEWAKAITAEDIQWGELMIDGENPIYRSLTESEIEGLLILFNGGLSFSVPPENAAWSFPTERMVTLCCGGIEYVLNLGPEPMTIICRDGRVDWKGEDTWFVNSDSLKHFIRQMPVQTQLEEAAVAGCIPSYVSTKCVYQWPAVSAVMPDDSGKNYLIGENLVAILDKNDNDAGEFYPNPPRWQTLTQTEWSKLFISSSAPDISGYAESRILRLSGECALVDLDGTLWILHLTKLDNGVGYRVFIAYELAPADPGPAFYQSVECMFTSPVMSSLPTADSGYYYLVQGDELRLINKRTGEAYSHTADGDWRELSDELIHDMEWGTVALGGTDLWETLRERRPMIRLYENANEVGELLLNFGDELWVGTYGYGRNGYTSISSVYRLEQVDESVVPTQEQLAVWHADLTHDGVYEIIALTEVTDGERYVLTVTDQTGKTLWEEEASTFHVGWNGIYLYEQDGKEYLMTWVPYGSTGIFDLRYEVFSLTDQGEQVVLVSDFFEFSAMGEEQILRVDVAALREFENEVNMLLSNAFVLIDTDNAKPVYSTQTNRVTRLWSGLSDSVERMQQNILNSMEPLAYWYADLTHDGRNEIIEVSRKTGESAGYCLNIRTTDGKKLWSTEIYDWDTARNGFYLYERDGKHYLLKWCPIGWQGWYDFNYKIYRLSEDAEPEIVEEDSLQYDLGAAGYREKFLTVDVEPLRAFEKKINALLEDAQVLLVVGESKVTVGYPQTPVSDGWTSPADEWERERQYQIAQLPLAWAGWEGDADLLNCVQEQTKLRMGSYELAYVDSPKEVPIADSDTTSGHFIYRVEYRPADYDEKTYQLTWHDNEYFYLITYGDLENDGWHFVGTLTETELQSSFNTPEMLAKYGDPYTAAAVEMV